MRVGPSLSLLVLSLAVAMGLWFGAQVFTDEDSTSVSEPPAQAGESVSVGVPVDREESSVERGAEGGDVPLVDDLVIPQESLAVRVLDSDGEPASGVDVLLVAKGAWPERDLDALRQGRTAEDGTCSWRGVADGTYAIFAERSEDEMRAWFSPVAILSTTMSRVVLSLAPGQFVYGTVTNVDHVPLEATLSLSGYELVDGRLQGGHMADASSNRRGRFLIGPVDCHTVELSSVAPNHFRSESGLCELPLGERGVRCDATLQPSVTIHGSWSVRGRPEPDLESALGECFLAGTGTDPEMLTKAPRGVPEQGLLDLDSRTYEITPQNQRTRFLSVWRGQQRLASAELRGVQGPTLDLDFDAGALPTPTRRVGGLVVRARDESGTALTDFTVDLMSLGNHSAGRVNRKLVAEGFECRVADLSMGRYRVSLFDEAQRRPSRVVSVLEDESTDVELVVPVSGGTVVGVVMSPDGQEVENAIVTASSASGEWDLYPVQNNTKTDAHGRFELEDLPPGACFLTCVADGLAPTVQPVVVPSVGEEDVLLQLARGERVQISLDRSGLSEEERLSLSGHVSYRILDAQGRAVVDQVFGCYVVESSGGWALRLTEGAYHVEVYTDGRCISQSDISVLGGQETEVTMTFDTSTDDSTEGDGTR